MTPEQLKASILQYAIQGKLVEQRPEEGTAEELFSKIVLSDRANSQCVKQKVITEITDGEKAYEIPDNWAWVKLGQVCIIARGGSPRPIKEYITTAGDGVNWIKIGDTGKNGKYICSTAEKIKPSGVLKSRMVHAGDFLLTNSMSFGHPYILKIDGCIHDGWLVISQVDNVFDQDYLYWLLSSNYAYTQFCGKVSGTVVKNLNSDKVANSVFPIPPIAEQKRIVAKIEEIMPLVERYAASYKKLERFNAKFPENMKKSILQYAIQGKLVEQRPEEGTAEELYRQIQEEKQRLLKEGKIKKEKPLPEITEEEKPFEIPESWKWVRLKNVVYNHGQITPSSTFSYIDIGSIDNKHQILNTNENILEADKAPSRARKVVAQGDILYSTVRPYLHNMCIVNREFSYTPIASTGFAVLSCCEGLSNHYLFYYLMAPFFDSYANANENSKGVAYPAINDDRLYRAVIALPPFAEQKRIVAKLEELLPLCERLK